MLTTIVRSVRNRLHAKLINLVVAPFNTSESILATTLQYAPDPGLLGPESISWRIVGDISSIVGGARSLLIQSAHVEVVSGVHEHSNYRSDPFGRLTRTAQYVNIVNYGAMPEVSLIVAMVNKAHANVKGVSQAGVPYNASDPALLSWVHNTLTDSLLSAYISYGPLPLSAQDADKFIVEQHKVGALLGANDMPSTKESLHAWIVDHPRAIATTAMRDSVAFIKKPPLGLIQQMGWSILVKGALSTVDVKLLNIIDPSSSKPSKFGTWATKRLLRYLRAIMGQSPSLIAAVNRVNANATL